MKNTLRLYAGIIRLLLWIVVIGILAIVLVQRLSNNEKSLAGIRVFTVITESMVPKYNIGDTIIVKETKPSDLRVGDDITYLGKEGTFADKYITHRIMDMDFDENGFYTFKTQGIANNEPDPEIDETQVYGKVIYKAILISKLNGVVGNMYSLYFVIVIPMAILTFFEFRVFTKKDDYEDDDDEEEKDSEELEDEEDINERLKDRRQRRKNRRKKRRKNKKE